MSTSKHFNKIATIITVLALVVTILFMNGEAFGLTRIVDADAEANSDSEYFTENDQMGEWDVADATIVTLDGDEITINGSGSAYVYDGDLHITNSGYFVIEGSLDDGSIIVDANDAAKVWIKLNGATINCSDDACIRVDEADKVFLTLAAGTENVITSGATYSEEALADGTGGAIYAHDDLTINGSGSLSVTAEYQHGIEANDDFVITGGTVSITAPADGINVNDSFRMKDAALTISAGDDGIHCDSYVYIESGTILIEECYEGIEGITIEMTGGDVTIHSTDDGMNANGQVAGMMGGMGEEMGGTQPGMEAQAEDMAQDAVMTEADEITADAGQTETEESLTVDDTWIRISGGTLTIINENGRDADGLDSNGNIYLEGGTVYVNVEGSSGTNSAVDYLSESGGIFQVNGGTLVACGGSSMAEGFDASSTQVGILCNLSESIAAGTEISLSDAEGNVLLIYTPVCGCNSVALSTAGIEEGETYTITAGELTEEVTVDSTAVIVGSGGMGGAGGMGGMQGGPMGGGMQSEANEESSTTEDADAQSEEQSSEESSAQGGKFGPGGRAGGTPPGMSEDGEMPTPPTASEDGEMPTPPTASEDGEMPTPPTSSESGEMPTPPTASEDGEMPAPPTGSADGEKPQMGAQGGMPAPGEAQSADTTTTEESVTSETQTDHTREWMLVGAAGAVLLVSILVVSRYRRNL